MRPDERKDFYESPVLILGNNFFPALLNLFHFPFVKIHSCFWGAFQPPLSFTHFDARPIAWAHANF